jgi:hypothetical protein
MYVGMLCDLDGWFILYAFVHELFKADFLILLSFLADFDLLCLLFYSKYCIMHFIRRWSGPLF